MVSIFNYTDYRKFLIDYHGAMKQENSRFSYRSLTMLAGINPGNFTKILKGERSLTLAAALKLARVMKFSKKERDYFQSVIMFCQESNHEDKKRCFEEMMSFKESSVRVLDSQQYEFYDKWYYTAVREALAFFPLTKNNFSELGKLIAPSISEREVAQALVLLLKLSLVYENKDGIYCRSDVLLSTGNNIKSLALNNFVIGAMHLAEQAISKGMAETNLSSITLSVSKDDFQLIQEEVRAFRRRIMDIARSSKNPNRVYQYNVQVFPLTKPYDREKP